MAEDNNNSNNSNKLKLGFLSPISGEWFHLHSDKIEMAKTIDEAKYIIFESNGDPIPLIMKIKAKYPKNIARLLNPNFVESVSTLNMFKICYGYFVNLYRRF